MKKATHECPHVVKGVCRTCANPLSHNPRFVSRKPLRKLNPKHRWR